MHGRCVGRSALCIGIRVDRSGATCARSAPTGAAPAGLLRTDRRRHEPDGAENEGKPPRDVHDSPSFFEIGSVQKKSPAEF
jgi:hypothetical protein